MYEIQPDRRASDANATRLCVAALIANIGLGCIHYLLLAFVTAGALPIKQRLVLSCGLIAILVLSSLMLYGRSRRWPVRHLWLLIGLSGVLWLLVYPTGALIMPRSFWAASM